MKNRWELEDGRINPLSSINADFHSLPTQLKVLIIHRLTEYRLEANVSLKCVMAQWAHIKTDFFVIVFHYLVS